MTKQKETIIVSCKQKISLTILFEATVVLK